MIVKISVSLGVNNTVYMRCKVKTQKIENGKGTLKMKLSKYNLIFDYRNIKLAFNSMTCALVIATNDFLRILEEVKNNVFHRIEHSKRELNLIHDMKEGGFIIDDCFDELKFLKFKNFQGKFQTNNFSLSIAPTFACNFACPYCYENTKAQFMTQETMDAICKEVETAAKGKKRIIISWYGGEPLLTKNIIWSLSDKFISYVEKYDAYYSAQIITNGYLLDNETIANLIKYKISRVQITIDGPADVHNSRRKLRNSSKPTFDTILNNAKKVLDAGIGVAIRINIDKNNEHRVDELLNTLLDYGLQNAYVYLGHVRVSTEFCTSISSNCLSKQDYAMKFANFEKILLDKGFNKNYYPNYPKTKSNNCTADSITSRVIAPDGSMYKCWHDISKPDMSIGNIRDLADVTDKNIMIQVKYMLSNPFKIDECKNCNVLPLCMGGCPTITNKVSCQNCKYSLVETLKQKYDLLIASSGTSNNQNLMTAKNEMSGLPILVKPITEHSFTPSAEYDCSDYNFSCGTPKLWWNLQL